MFVSESHRDNVIRFSVPCNHSYCSSVCMRSSQFDFEEEMFSKLCNADMLLLIVKGLLLWLRDQKFNKIYSYILLHFDKGCVHYTFGKSLKLVNPSNVVFSPKFNYKHASVGLKTYFLCTKCLGNGVFLYYHTLHYFAIFVSVDCLNGTIQDIEPVLLSIKIN